MKLKSLILGSVAAAGLSTAGFAADLGVLTSLDVCDALGLSGLTISSDTNCLQISGGAIYEFRFGDYRATEDIGRIPFGNDPFALGTVNVDSIAPNSDPVTGNRNDWQSRVQAWLKFVGTADSDFGPAKAVVKLKGSDGYRFSNGNAASDAWGDNNPEGFFIDEAYVSVGDTTVIMAGKKGSIANFGDSEPFNYLKLFGYSKVDSGVGFDNDDTPAFLGGHVIQVVSDLGNGVSVAAGLENIGGDMTAFAPATANNLPNGYANNGQNAGTLVGVLSYAGEGVTAHVTGMAIGVLDGTVNAWGLHAGATGTFDQFKVRAAGAYFNDSAQSLNKFHGLVSGQATFDMFTLALSGEYQRKDVAGAITDGYGIGGSIGATVTEGVSINLGARYFNLGNLNGVVTNEGTTQVSAQLVAAVTETIKVTGELGGYFNNVTLPNAPGVTTDSVYYGAAELAWAPGGGFKSSIKGEVYSNSAYRFQFKAEKSFE
ncbi:hypothetical protein JP75_08675 [Devosia riboflavina]|uniref:Porin n=1 Tax=Devosia riboflavina TaxID=46914 RepID=A0A087M3Z0_9HYPH|nr:hypothetical protein [Devosia riboflavina]KFL31593.1 hypothetical protein JP75_08675 [Devosia riboflavina]